MRPLIMAALGASLAGNALALAYVATMPATANPNVLSIRFLDRATALDYYNEARSLGECVKLDTMDDGGLPYWLHTCAKGA